MFNKDKIIPCESDTFVSSVLSWIKSHDSPLSSKSADRDDSHWENLSEFDTEILSSLLMVVVFPHVLLLCPFSIFQWMTIPEQFYMNPSAF